MDSPECALKTAVLQGPGMVVNDLHEAPYVCISSMCSNSIESEAISNLGVCYCPGVAWEQLNMMTLTLGASFDI